MIRGRDSDEGEVTRGYIWILEASGNRWLGRRLLAMGASAVTVLALILVPAAMSSASPTTDTFYAYPQGTGTDCTSNTFSTSDCDLTQALIAVEGSTADSVYLYLETTGNAGEFINEAPVVYLTGSSQITIEPSPTLSGNTVIDGSGTMSGNGILTLNGTSTGSVTFNDITFQNGYNGGLGTTFGGALSMQATFDVTINNCISSTTKLSAMVGRSRLTKTSQATTRSPWRIRRSPATPQMKEMAALSTMLITDLRRSTSVIRRSSTTWQTNRTVARSTVATTGAMVR